MGKTLKMPNQIKELLEIQKVPAETVEIIEDYYSGVMDEVVEHYENEKPKKEMEKAPSVAEMARAARIVK